MGSTRSLSNYRRENKVQEEAKKSSQTVRMEHGPSRELVEVIISGLGWAGQVGSGAPSLWVGPAKGDTTLAEGMPRVWV